MKGLVRLSLRRPYTSAVAALLILLMGGFAVTRMIVDIFPIIDIPVVLVAWNYPGLSATDMERRVVLPSERSYAQNVNGIDHIESESIPSTGIIKLYFQPGSDIGGAIAQVESANDSILRQLPPGITPPNVIQFNASSVPILQVTATSKTVPEQVIADYALNFLRLKLFTVPGLAITAPYGGMFRQILVQLDSSRLEAKGVSATDVVSALTSSNVTVPAGVAHIAGREYNVALNSSPPTVDLFNQLPLGMRNGVPVTLGDVAHVADTAGVRSTVAHINGERAVYLLILRHSDASTLAVVDATRDLMPEIKASAPDGIDLSLDFDQSVFVRSAISNVVREAVISSILVSLMILLFLGSWRSTTIVALSIPLSIFAAIVGLLVAGQSINLMTLGGLALAIGLLVDNATVTIENIHRNQSLGKPLTVAILDGTGEVVQPLTVATLAMCIVFFPVVLLTGPARFLFIPLAITVVLALLASFFLSFSLVPSFTRFLLAAEDHAAPPTGFLGRAGAMFQSGFERFRDGYGRALTRTLDHRGFVLVAGGLLLVVSGGLATVVGTDFFPISDVGLIKLHYRAPIGTRIEETEKLVLAVDNKIRELIPPEELNTINDISGVPNAYNLSTVPSDNLSSGDAEILVQLKSPHRPSVNYIRKIRDELPKDFPGSQFYFQNADIVSQVLNFGQSAPIDVQIQAADFNQAQALAQKLLMAMRIIPGVVNSHIIELLNYPSLEVDVDRLRAAELGITQQQIANNVARRAVVEPAYFAEFVPQPDQQRQLQRLGHGPDPADRHGARTHGDFRQPAKCAHARNGDQFLGDRAQRTGDTACRRRLGTADHELRIREPLYRGASRRCRGQCRRSRPWRRRERSSCRDREPHEGPAAFHSYRYSRPEPGHGNLVPQFGARPHSRRHSGLRPPGHSVPVLDRSFHHHDGVAGRAHWHHLDAGADGHDDQRRNLSWARS